MMKPAKCACGLRLGLLAMGIGWIASAADRVQADEGEIRLIVRGDDIGSSHAANVGCIRSYREGIVRSVEVMVPCPWFNEAVKMLRENPGLDVGVHLTLTAEWELVKWGPMTHGPSLVDRQGKFFPMTWQRKDSPPHMGFLNARPKLDEVQKELRAQIELAVAEIPQVSHLSCHMGTATTTPELRALVERLAEQYKLPLGAPGAKPAGGFGGKDDTPAQRESALVDLLQGLKPGLWILVEHPAIDTPEMRSVGHVGYRNVAADRDGVTRAFTSNKVKKVVEQRGIKLISYAELDRD